MGKGGMVDGCKAIASSDGYWTMEMGRPDVELLPGAATSTQDADAFITDSMHGLAAVQHHFQRGHAPP